MEEPKTINQINDEIIACTRCPRLVAWREEVALKKRRAYADWEYWGRPVPGFGDPQARLLIVGLAPGAHGSNRTGRMFTGDSSGDFLYPALYRAGFASQPDSNHRGDGLALRDAFMAATCHCAPPDNKPMREEIENCRPYMVDIIRALTRVEGVVALGKIGFDSALAAYRVAGYEVPRMEFGHNLLHEPGNGLPWFLASYHPSRQNTQTGRLTVEMFDAVWQRAAELLNRKHG
jgi:uracil-DNA glycosylase family 4